MSVDNVYKQFLFSHSEQLKNSGIPEIYWPTLFVKVDREVFDAGDCFMIQKVLIADDNEETSEQGGEDENEVTASQTVEDKEECTPGGEADHENYTWRVINYKENGIDPSDQTQIYLVDHAWTYRVEEARQHLLTIPGLLQRMVNLFELPVEGKSQAELVDEVFHEMWRYNQTYQVNLTGDAAEDKLPYWYVMDEFGSRIQHSDTPSVRMVPFFYVPRQCSYTIMWPLQQLNFEDEITRDYVEFVKDNDELRKLHLIPWQPCDCTDNSTELGPEHYIVRYQMKENLPNPEIGTCVQPLKRKGLVYTKNRLLQIYYEPNEFYHLSDSLENVDVEWQRTEDALLDYRSFGESYPKRFINEFPCEAVLTVKSVMYAAAMYYLLKKGLPPVWLQESYNLHQELKEFVAAFQKRQARGDYNTWIVKPCCLGRSIDMQITDNLDYILRLSESRVKMVSEYIEHPVLYNQDGVGAVKFDLRFMVLLHTVKPLKVFLHKTFSVRSANRPFSMTDFDDFEKHFTVMNVKGLDYKMIHPEEFVKNFEKQYPDYQWEELETEIQACIKSLMEAVTLREPPFGIGHSPQSRALYGLDVMLKWTKKKDGGDKMQPVIFECNNDPNFERQCIARKEFFTDVYRALFMDDLTDAPIVEL